mgnify:CR=1 FL=1
MTPTAQLADDCPDFKFIEFNARRWSRGADAAKYEVDGEWCWMSREDIRKNIAMFGKHPALVHGIGYYESRGRYA